MKFQLAALASIAAASCLAAGSNAPVALHWLGDAKPDSSAGATWGVPWPQGKIARDTAFDLRDGKGASVPVQSWPLAYWPDGSLKWTAHAIPAGEAPDSMSLAPGSSALPQQAVRVIEKADGFEVDTGAIKCVVPREGKHLIKSVGRAREEQASNATLICLREDADGSNKEEFEGEISSVTLEQRGPVRAVLKLEGKHANANRQWLPFVVRLYFYAGSDAIRVVHSFVYDGDQNKDFIRGLGLRFDVPMRGALYDRHVRFVGSDGGVWGEAVRGVTGLRRDPGKAVRQAQIDGTATPPIDQWSPRVTGHLDFVPAFGDFVLFQPNAESFEIRKRTKDGFAWLNSAYGRRAAGLGYIGSPEGGVVFGVRNFWQSHPSALEISGATGDRARVTMWLWSPEARPMDLRSYHDGMGQDSYEKQLRGLDITYEDYEPGFADPHGIARTSEMMLWAVPATPPRTRLADLANSLNSPALPVCNPSHYKATEIFGGAIWGLPDTSTPARAAIEGHIDYYLDSYIKEVEQRRWYGFWNYGDVMHTYDSDRHVWRYDVGGYAWDNSELSTDLWLWYSFLRTGRADVFRMAEAMTRHTGEVDVYHLGRFAGLGSRHNVLHWGDSAKQLRISTAANRRFLYYLTADERVGDLMRELLDADRRLAEIPPTRKIVKTDFEGKPFRMTMGVGTDWTSLASAWLTEWERTGNTKYRDKIVAGMEGIAGLAHGWLSGSGGYDPETGKFFPNGEALDVSHLNVVFGGFEINAELLQLLDVPSYERTWLQYCELYNASPEEQKAALGNDLGELNLRQGHSRLTAYAGWKTGDPKYGKRAWDEFLGAGAGVPVMQKPYPVKLLHAPDVLGPIEEASLNSNTAAQFVLAAIEDLALAGKYLPKNLPESHDKPQP